MQTEKPSAQPLQGRDAKAIDMRSRLAVVAARYSQSEIARKTNMPVASVHRYLRKTRVPADFCTALVNGLGVNPSWLLTGEGAPWLADVRGETGKLAGDLLELVGAMNAVSRMRLGSLAGKAQSKMLRELSDALQTYEQLREKLNEQSRPIFHQVLKDWRESLFKRNLAESDALSKAARQVSRLCDDDELARDYLSVSAHHALNTGNTPMALSLQRKALLASLTSGDFPTEASFAEARRLCVELNHAARTRESLRYTRALLLLARDKARHWPSYANFQAFYGFLLIGEGKPERGIRLIKQTLPKLEGPPRESAKNSMMLGLFLTGAINFDTAKTMGDSTVHAEVLQAMAIWLSEKSALKAANATYEKATQGHAPERYETVLIKALLLALEGDARKALATYREHSHMPDPKPDQNPLGHVTMAIDYTHLLRLCGKENEAREWLKRSEDLVAALAPGVELGVFQKTAHWRNMLSGDGAQKKQARRNLKAMARQGYSAFAKAIG